MMMKKILLFAATAMLLAISCSKEDEVKGRPNYGNSGKEKVVFYATTESTASPETKVYADEDLRVLWNENDCISLFNYANVNDKYIFDGEDGDNGGSFSFEEEGPEPSTPVDLDHIYAVYPYSANTEASVDDSQVTIAVDLPAEQAYKEHSFGIGANTMVAVTDNNFLPFKNVCGYLKFRFYGDDVTISSITIEGNNGEKIAGKAYITPSFESAPTITMDDAATTSITIKDNEPITLGTSSTDYTEFIYVLPPTTFENGFKVTVTDIMGGVFEKSSTKSLTISRNKMEGMSVMKIVPGFVVFDDENFEAYCVENFDSNGDGKISFAEALVPTRIDVSVKNITSLKGIEHFKNIKTLRCADNQLTSLDVTSNTALELLACHNNQLTSLDVSNNPVLNYLQCDNNQLTSLDMTNNTALARLECSNNQLTSLDMTNNTALNLLWCHKNQLTNLNVTKNTALTNLRCHDNQLTNLNVTNNTALTYLQCYSNLLTSLDVSNNTALDHLRCDFNQLTSLNVINNTALENLNCASNQLTSLDVTNNTALIYLQCYTNQLASLNVSKNIALTYLNCNYNQLTSLDVTNNTALIYLNCRTNQLTSLDVMNNTALTELYCFSNQLTSLDVTNNTALTVLDCYGNQLTSLNVNNNTALENLDCANNQLTSLDLSNNTMLTKLHCHYNQLTNLDLTNNTALTELNCSRNQLTSLDVSHNTSLSNLNAWPQAGTLSTLIKKKGQTISYGETPSDYGTTIIEVE